MTPDMMVTTDLEGRKVAGERDPSSELLMHLAVYQNRPEAKAVVHAHPPAATGFAVAGIPLDRAVLAEVVTTLGSIPIADYGTPSTPELADAVSKYIKAHDGLLLANHGALTTASRTVRGVLQDGNDRALCQDQSCGPPARSRARCCRERKSCGSRICEGCMASRHLRPFALTGPRALRTTREVLLDEADDVTCQTYYTRRRHPTARLVTEGAVAGP